MNDAPPPADPLLQFTVTEESGHLAVQIHRGPVGLTEGKPVWIDWSSIDTSSGPGRSLKQPLLRAVGLRKGDPYRPWVFDATCGYGEDAFLLASLGCRVTACEQHPTVFSLAHDAWLRAQAAGLPGAAKEQLQLIQGDSISELLRLQESGTRPEVVYLDPMFPEGRRSMEKKPMRLIRALAGPDRNGASHRLLEAALASARHRVVVKRPLHAASLEHERRPDASHAGKGIRFDVYGVAVRRP